MTTSNHTNRLSQETSPYLKQHAHNPVDWYPWGPEALERARREDKPIFLSIGYSTCHWCHVMAHESFENPAIAAIMNEHFVCIKLDREERPDLDETYMSAVQILTGNGGNPFIEGGWMGWSDMDNGSTVTSNTLTLAPCFQTGVEASSVTNGSPTDFCGTASDAATAPTNTIVTPATAVTWSSLDNRAFQPPR